MLKRFMQKLKKFLVDLFSSTPLYSFKIAGVRVDPNNKHTEVTYQVSGKSTVINDMPANLLSELMILKGFSKDDSNLILNLFIEEQKYPSYKIKNMVFSHEDIEFEIQDLKSNSIIRITSEMLIEHKDFLKQFSYSDLLILNYYYLQIINKKEKKAMSNIKKEFLLKSKKSFSLIRDAAKC
jgi:hypothetical protein